MGFTTGDVAIGVTHKFDGGWGVSPMVTSMKSTHGSPPFKHSVGRLYIAHLFYKSFIELTWERTRRMLITEAHSYKFRNLILEVWNLSATRQPDMFGGNELKETVNLYMICTAKEKDMQRYTS